MIRPRQDLEAIDRELDQLGKPRADIAELVARYGGRVPSDALFDGLRASVPVPDPGSVPPSAPHEGSAEFAAGRATAGWSAEDADGAHALELSEDHDEFELLVEDEELIEDEQFEPV